MALNLNARFYRLNRLPNFDAGGKHVGLFVYVPEHIMQANEVNDSAWIQGYAVENWNGNYPLPTGNPITVSYLVDDGSSDFQQAKINGGLWFGGRFGWELLSNVGAGLDWPEIYAWFDHDIAGEAEIFDATELTATGQTGTEITIFDPILDRADGLHASTDGSDAHKFTVGDGALKISGHGATNTSGQTPTIPDAVTNDVHSANDVLSSILTLDESLIWTPSGNAAPYNGIIGVRVNQNVTPTNPIATMDDIAGLNGAMHLVGTLDSSTDYSTYGAEHIWPDQTGSHWITTGTPGTDGNNNPQVLLKEGDTFIVTTEHTGPDSVKYEVADTVLFYKNAQNVLTYKVVNQNITTGTRDGQHAPVDMPGGQLVAGNIVVATTNGIKTIDVNLNDFIIGLATEQEIVNTNTGDFATEPEHEGEIHGAMYTATTTITRPDGSDSDSEVDTSTDVHSFTLHSNNTSLTIKEHVEAGESDGNQQFDFDLVWLTEMDGFTNA